MDSRIADGPERRLLAEIGGISARVRELRASPRGDSAQLKSLEAQSRQKWEELRALRAGPVNQELPAPNLRGHYR